MIKIPQLEHLMGYSGDFRFAAPIVLFALLALPFILWWILHRERAKTGTIQFANVGLIKKTGIRQGRGGRVLLATLRVLVLALLIVAMARPQYGRVEHQTYNEGIDIELVLDVSLSMRANDFRPNRLEAAKSVMQDFVDGRRGDRVGLVIFGSEATALIPLTLDYGVVKSFIKRIDFRVVDGNSTAIGMGLATGLNKLRESKAKSKVVILLTDGENNAGKIDPLTAAEAARTSKVRVYTIGVGSEIGQMTPFGFRNEAGIDEKTLKQIAELTGGLYFRATDNEKLQEIYQEIDKLEKSRVESTQFDNFSDLMTYAAVPALLLLLAELLLRSTRFLKIP